MTEPEFSFTVTHVAGVKTYTEEFTDKTKASTHFYALVNQGLEASMKGRKVA